MHQLLDLNYNYLAKTSFLIYKMIVPDLLEKSILLCNDL